MYRSFASLDPEAVLWGTTSPSIRDNPASIREYFDFLRTAPPYYKGVLGEQRIRVYGDMAINTGTYTFIGPALDAAGKPVSRPARFSFEAEQTPSVGTDAREGAQAVLDTLMDKLAGD